ncbi:MAG: D-2-hydroxyacid dehydrogenase [Paenibacillus sp.]|jgi:phosphoglycerate dehydrogenase-like enzyme|nr:D-2-hydroxyacid dehydrogenase [Paenibacillus sp.]
MLKHILIDVVVHEEKLRRLREIPGVLVETIEPDESAARVLPAAVLQGKHVLFCMYPPVNHEALDALEWIQVASAGYAQLFPLDLPGRGIRATNSRGNVDVPIAEWNMAMIVNLSRDMKRMVVNQEQKVWEKQPRFSNEIRGRTVGIWGYGCIGRETARLAKAYSMKVHVMDRFVYNRSNGPLLYTIPGIGDPDGLLPDKVFQPGQEEAFLGELDYLILTLPLTESSRGIIGERELRMLPDHAFVLNPARGPLIQEQALLQALDEGWIAGAALDTHYYYPMPAGHPLWNYPNVIMTPHISGSPMGPHFRERLWEMFIANVERYVGGEPLFNELNAEQLRGQ